jgi:hypothetical protein
MNTTAKEHHSLAVSDSEYFNDRQDKIELVSCTGGNETKCKKHLFVLNQNFHNSDDFRREKLFQLSIEELKHAYFKTFELSDKSCLNCAKLFRSTITDSLVSIRDELKSMTSGFFGNKHYELGYHMAEEVLQEFEKAKLLNMSPIKETKERYIESYQKKLA